MGHTNTKRGEELQFLSGFGRNREKLQYFTVPGNMWAASTVRKGLKRVPRQKTPFGCLGLFYWHTPHSFNPYGSLNGKKWTQFYSSFVWGDIKGCYTASHKLVIYAWPSFQEMELCVCTCTQNPHKSYAAVQCSVCRYISLLCSVRLKNCMQCKCTRMGSSENMIPSDTNGEHNSYWWTSTSSPA